MREWRNEEVGVVGGTSETPTTGELVFGAFVGALGVDALLNMCAEQLAQERAVFSAEESVLSAWVIWKMGRQL